MKQKLIKSKVIDGNTVYTYKCPIIAGMQFTYPGTTCNKLKAVGHYFFEMVISPLGETVSEKTYGKVFY